MDSEKFKDKFHPSWWKKIKPFIESKECDKIFEFIKSESRKGKIIAPESVNLFRAFKETSLDDLKVVILGMAPYHTLKNNKIIADGLLMGCSITEYLQPSLNQFYEALQYEFCNGVDIIKDPDVTYLANQGVLMLNAALTTEIGKAGNHLEVWRPFIKFLFEEILAVTGVPIVFLGKDAAFYDRYTQIFSTNYLLSHPASASYQKTKWSSEGAFKKVSVLIKENNNFEINWLKQK